MLEVSETHEGRHPPGTVHTCVEPVLAAIGAAALLDVGRGADVGEALLVRGGNG